MEDPIAHRHPKEQKILNSFCALSIIIYNICEEIHGYHTFSATIQDVHPLNSYMMFKLSHGMCGMTPSTT